MKNRKIDILKERQKGEVVILLHVLVLQVKAERLCSFYLAASLLVPTNTNFPRLPWVCWKAMEQQ